MVEISFLCASDKVEEIVFTGITISTRYLTPNKVTKTMSKGNLSVVGPDD